MNSKDNAINAFRYKKNSISNNCNLKFEYSICVLVLIKRNIRHGLYGIHATLIHIQKGNIRLIEGHI